MKKQIAVLLIVLCAWVGMGSVAVAGEETLEADFAELSSRVRSAMDLKTTELEVLLKRCEELRQRARMLEGSRGKILRKKMRRTCGVYDYVLDSKRAAASVAGD